MLQKFLKRAEKGRGVILKKDGGHFEKDGGHFWCHFGGGSTGPTMN